MFRFKPFLPLVFLALATPAARAAVTPVSWSDTNTSGFHDDLPGYFRVDANGNAFSIIQSGTTFSVAKVSKTGALQWQYYFNAGIPSNDTPNGLTLDANGDVYVSGVTSRLIGNFRGFALKLRGTDGGLLWTRYASDAVTNSGSGPIEVDGLGRVYWSSEFYNPTQTGRVFSLDAATGNPVRMTDLPGEWVNRLIVAPNGDAVATTQTRILRLRQIGGVLWSRLTSTVDANLRSYDLKVNSAGQPYLYGRLQTGDNPNVTLKSILVRLNFSDGRTVWQQIQGDPDRDVFVSGDLEFDSLGNPIWSASNGIGGFLFRKFRSTDGSFQWGNSLLPYNGARESTYVIDTAVDASDGVLVSVLSVLNGQWKPAYYRLFRSTGAVIAKNEEFPGTASETMSRLFPLSDGTVIGLGESDQLNNNDLALWRINIGTGAIVNRTQIAKQSETSFVNHFASGPYTAGLASNVLQVNRWKDDGTVEWSMRYTMPRGAASPCVYDLREAPGGAWVLTNAPHQGSGAFAGFRLAADNTAAWQFGATGIAGYPLRYAVGMQVAADGTAYVVGVPEGQDGVVVMALRDNNVLWQKHSAKIRPQGRKSIAVGPNGDLYVAGLTTNGMGYVQFAKDTGAEVRSAVRAVNVAANASHNTLVQVTALGYVFVHSWVSGNSLTTTTMFSSTGIAQTFYDQSPSSPRGSELVPIDVVQTGSRFYVLSRLGMSGKYTSWVDAFETFDVNQGWYVQLPRTSNTESIIPDSLVLSGNSLSVVGTLFEHGSYRNKSVTVQSLSASSGLLGDTGQFANPNGADVRVFGAKVQGTGLRAYASRQIAGSVEHPATIQFSMPTAPPSAPAPSLRGNGRYRG